MIDAKAFIFTQGLWQVVSYTHSPNEERIRVRILKSRMSQNDIKSVRGERENEEGRVLGGEAIGVIECIPSSLMDAAAQQNISVGTKVLVSPYVPCCVCDDCKMGYTDDCSHATVLGKDEDGTFATHIDVPLSVLVPVPADMPDEHVLYAKIVAFALKVCALDDIETIKFLGVMGRGDSRQVFVDVVKQQMQSNERLVVTAMDPRSVSSYQSRFDAMVEACSDISAVSEMVQALRDKGLLILHRRALNMAALPHQLVRQKRIRDIQVYHGSYKDALEWISSHPKTFEHLKSDYYELSFSDPDIASKIHNAPSTARVVLSW